MRIPWKLALIIVIMFIPTAVGVSLFWLRSNVEIAEAETEYDAVEYLVVLVDPPYIMSRPTGLDGQLMAALHFFGWEFGGHGYAPDVPEMGATFMAVGRGVPAGLALDEVHQIDLAPTVAKLLAIDPPQQSEGVAVDGFDYSAGGQQAGEVR